AGRGGHAHGDARIDPDLAVDVGDDTLGFTRHVVGGEAGRGKLRVGSLLVVHDLVVEGENVLGPRVVKDRGRERSWWRDAPETGPCARRRHHDRRLVLTKSA